ncbi:MAG: hypothetical protein U0Y82_00455 [Thermoleophilia bacterium]
MAALALGAAVVLAGCGGGGNHPHWQPTNGIEHMRSVRTGLSPGTGEDWEYRPLDGCWRMRSIVYRHGHAVPQYVSTVVRGADGRLSRRMWMDGSWMPDSTAPQSNPCVPLQTITELQLVRLWAQNYTPVSTATVAGRALQTFHISLADAALGIADPARGERAATVVSRPPGRPAVLLYDPARRVPVRLTVPAVTVRIGTQRDTVGASVTRFTLVEEIPATTANLKVFDRP